MSYQKKYLKYKAKYIALKEQYDLSQGLSDNTRFKAKYIALKEQYNLSQGLKDINLDGSGNFGSKAKVAVGPSPADMSLIDAEKQKAFKNLYKLIKIDLNYKKQIKRNAIEIDENLTALDSTTLEQLKQKIKAKTDEIQDKTSTQIGISALIFRGFDKYQSIISSKNIDEIKEATLEVKQIITNVEQWIKEDKEEEKEEREAEKRSLKIKKYQARRAILEQLQEELTQREEDDLLEDLDFETTSKLVFEPPKVEASVPVTNTSRFGKVLPPLGARA
jgi:hypothetical protein